MGTVDAAMTVGEIARENLGAALVFEQLGIDYCCGGKRSLSDAAAKRGLDGATVAAMLNALGTGVAGGAVHDVSGLSPSELCDHIERTHHAAVAADLERIGAMTAKVARRHGPGDPTLVEVDRVFRELRTELEEHMALEEDVTFPAIRALERREGADLASLAGLEDDHDAAGRGLALLRELCHGYDVDTGYCMTHRTMLGALAAFEREMHQHVHEENNILFPAARALAATAA